VIDWTNLVAFVVGMAGTAVTWWISRRARVGEHDKTVHEKRLDAYPKLVRATSPLAVFFPHTEKSALAALDKDACAEIGAACSRWYFSEGGLLLSRESRDRYFALVTALNRAAYTDTPLSVPAFPGDATLLSVELVDQYREELAGSLDLNAVATWEFGKRAAPAGTALAAAYRFKDYVFLQRLSSRLRTTLAQDLRSRRRPS
jgi:hypothetical protein